MPVVQSAGAVAIKLVGAIVNGLILRRPAFAGKNLLPQGLHWSWPAVNLHGRSVPIHLSTRGKQPGIVGGFYFPCSSFLSGLSVPNSRRISGLIFAS